MKKIKKKKKGKVIFFSEENLNFSCEIEEFKEDGSQGKFKGILVNMQGNNTAKGVYRFKQGSMKKNNGKTLFMQYNHNGSQIPVGTLVGQETDKGFEVEGIFHLQKDEQGNYINQEAAKLYSLMKDLGAKFEMSVGGVIKEYKEYSENGKWYIDILEFEAYEGSLTPRGAVPGSKVTKVFNENIGGNKMEKEQLELLLRGILENFRTDLLKAGTPEELQKLPEQFKNLVATFDGMKENLEADLKESFSKQIEELNDVIKGLKADFKATPKEVTIAEQFAAMIQEVEKNGKSVETVFTGQTEVEFTDPANTTNTKAAVKTHYVNTILERIAEINPVLADIKFITITDGSLTIPREVAGLPETGWIGEEATREETSVSKIEQVNIVLHQLYAMPKVTNKLLATNFIGYANFLLKRVEYALALKLADALFNGTGTNMPTGILKDASVTNSKVFDDTDDETLVNSIVEAYYTLDENAARNAKWYITPETWARIAKLKNKQQDFYITDLNNGNTRTLMARPVVLITSENAGIKGIDKASADEIVGVFADLEMSVAAIQNNAMAIRMEDKVTSKGFTKYYIEKGVGLGVQLPEYILKLVKKS